MERQNEHQKREESLARGINAAADSLKKTGENFERGAKALGEVSRNFGTIRDGYGSRSL